jgi:HEAT repeat protein
MMAAVWAVCSCLLLALTAEGPWVDAATAAAPALEAPDRGRRAEAVLALAAIEGETASEALRKALEDGEPAVRNTAARILARRADGPGLAAVAGWIPRGQPPVRLAALEALRLAPALPPGVRAVVERALGDPDVTARLAALEALAADPAPSVVRIAYLLEDSAPAVRLAAVRLLDRARRPQVVPALLARLADADRSVQREAVAALGRLGDARVSAALLKVLNDGPDELRLAAMDAAAALRLPAAVEPLARHARRRPTDALARQAQRALGEIATPAALAVLLDLLRAGPPLSPEMEEALVRNGPAALPALRRMLDPGSQDPRATAAAEVLARWQAPPPAELAPALGAHVRGRGSTAPAALRALRGQRDPRSLLTLVEAASDPSPLLRRLALEAIADMDDDRGAVAVPAALVHPDPVVRRLGLQLIARWQLADQLPAVRARLRDADPRVRRQAVRALAALARPGTAADLVQALPVLRGAEAAVGEALGRVAQAADIAPLTAAARAPTGGAGGRQAALTGLVGAMGAAGPGHWRDVRGAVALAAGALLGPGATAELAADVLAAAGTASLTSAPALRMAFEAASPSVRARLCPPMALLPDGAARLIETLVRPGEQPEVQAAAAWALAGSADPSARAGLAHAARNLHPAVAANARAALAQPRGAAGGVLHLRLVSPAGAPEPGHWVLIEATTPAGPALAVWARSGTLGQLAARLPGARSVSVRLPELQLRLDHPGDGVGEVAGHDVPAAELAARLDGGFPMHEHARSSGVHRRQALRQQAGDHARQHVAAARRP